MINRIASFKFLLLLVIAVIAFDLSTVSFAEAKNRKDSVATNLEEVTNQQAVKFIQNLADGTLMSLTTDGANRESREKLIRKVLRDNFDIDTIGRFAMGTHWRNATEEQKKEYLKLFEEMIIVTYTSRFEDYSGQKLEVLGAVSAGRRDILVRTRIVEEGAPPLAIEWRLRGSDNSLKVIDVIVEGISMSVTQRSDFDSEIHRGGGKIKTFLKTLNDRNEEARKIASKG